MPLRLGIDRHYSSWPQNCNRCSPMPVMIVSVDAISTTWILMQAHWWKLRCDTTMRRLANWFDASIPWSRKSSAGIAHAEPPKRIFAK